MLRLLANIGKASNYSTQKSKTKRGDREIDIIVLLAGALVDPTATTAKYYFCSIGHECKNKRTFN
jgi:hypothetical protein